MSDLLTFAVVYRWPTAPTYRPHRYLQETVTFRAACMLDCYRLAEIEGRRRYPRRAWTVLCCVEVGPGGNMPASEDVTS